MYESINMLRCVFGKWSCRCGATGGRLLPSGWRHAVFETGQVCRVCKYPHVHIARVGTNTSPIIPQAVSVDSSRTACER